MLRVKEALAHVLRRAKPLPHVERPLEECLGRRLAGPVKADADQPPFDKALVDGYAVRTADLAGPPATLAVVETILAGQTPTRPLAPGEAAAIMTGAPLPPEADGVVMVERTDRDGDSVRIDEQPIKPGMNRLERGRVYRAGDELLAAGARLNPARAGLLAAAGAAQVTIFDRPRVAIVPTGDELVDFRSTPGPGRIRNSNALMLEALATRKGVETWTLPILRDDPGVLREGLEQALEADVVMVVGGVSAGAKDLVPQVLRDLGVEEVFHKVRIKPGKPLWFGVGPGRDGRPPALVFGLPGNPLSGLVSFIHFVAPALEILEGGQAEGPDILPAHSARRLEHSGELWTCLPARVVDPERRAGRPPTVEPIDWAGSADLTSAARADGLLVLPDRETTVEPGEIVGFLPLD